MSVFLERTKREFLTQNFSIDKPPRPLPQQLKNNQRVVTIENNKKWHTCLASGGHNYNEYIFDLLGVQPRMLLTDRVSRRHYLHSLLPCLIAK